MSTSQRTIALLQFCCSADGQSNWEKAEYFLREAAAQGAQIACLPELFLSQYFCQSEEHDCFALAEPIPGATTGKLAKLAKELQLVIVASLFEKRAPGLYHNSAALLDADGSYLGKYRKMHIPDDPLFYEKFYFTPGDLGFHSWKTQAGNVGVLICWDQWFPEAARLTALRGAEILFYPTAIGWQNHEKAAFGAAQQDSWILAQRAHALANGIFVAAVNRTGYELPEHANEHPRAGIEFWGSSFVVAPNGQIIAQAGIEEETALVVELDLDQITTQRTHWPFLRDRRNESYAEIEKKYLQD